MIPIRNKNKQEENKQVINLNKSLTSVQEAVEYFESTFISMEDSKEANYDSDIYVSFKFNLYEGDESKEIYFKNFYEKIAMVTKFQSFRIIDRSKNVTIAVKCSNKKISEVLINGQADYYKKEASRRSQSKELNVETLDLEVNSEVLKNLINAGWQTSKVDLGTQESSWEKYQVYFDEGYEIRTIKGKVYNIIFTKNYNEKVVEDYKPGDSLEKIEAVLGTSYKDSLILGYKTKDFYIYFSDNEISVYPNYKYEYTEFEELVKEYNEKKDINDFMDKLTDIWPDYDQYNYDTGYVEICYSLKGVKIAFNSGNNEGIQIYENYKGDLKESKTEYKDVYYKLDKNLLIEREVIRPLSKTLYDNSGIDEDPIHYSNRFYLSATSDGNTIRNTKIISLDEDYPNNQLDDSILIYTYVWADDTHLVYSIYRNGIYVYNAETRETEKIIDGTETYEITNYNREANVMEYDGEKVQINF